MRIIQPVSKLESLEYLSQMFGITYKRGNLYDLITSFSALKNVVEKRQLYLLNIIYILIFQLSSMTLQRCILKLLRKIEINLENQDFQKITKPTNLKLLLA